MRFLTLNSSVEEILEAMKYDEKANLPSGFAIVLDESQTVLGVISDSDIRKRIVMQKINPRDLTAQSLMRSDFLFLYDFELRVHDYTRLTSTALERKIDIKATIQFIPVLDAEHKLVRVLHITDLIQIWQNFNEQIVVVGLGFVGLTLALSIAEKGKTVIGIDSQPEVIDRIKSLNPGIYEPELDLILKNTLGFNFNIFNVGEFVVTPNDANPKVYIVCVGTPVNFGEIITSQIDSVINRIATVLKKGDTIILRSTLPIGFSRKIANKIMKETKLLVGIDFYFGYAPERNVEGNAIKELINIPQIYSGYTEACSAKIEKVFDSLVNSKIKCESLEACELGKLMSNSFRDVIFAFSNEISLIARQYNLDINKLIDEVNTGYPRNGIAKPSPGVGGPCLSKDSYILLNSLSLDYSVIKSARELNEDLPRYRSTQIFELIKGIDDPKILILGLTFEGEPETNDIRNSPSLEIIKILMEEKIEKLDLRAHDPMLTNFEIRKLNINPYTENELWQPNLVCILNNNFKNFLLFKGLLDKLTSIKLFDPWYICSSLYNDPKIKIINTISKTLSIDDN